MTQCVKDMLNDFKCDCGGEVPKTPAAACLFDVNDKANKLPKGHPVKMEITDPNGKLVFKKVTSDHLNNFYKFIVVLFLIYLD